MVLGAVKLPPTGKASRCNELENTSTRTRVHLRHIIINSSSSVANSPSRKPVSSFKMAYQVPMDLIERARVLLREETGLQSYNPSDPSFPSLPTVEAVIAGFDPSPDCPRCEHCKGKLLRDSQSLICVYCGRELKRECPPDPISFKSTIGFRWLLDSLGLDGSEIIEPSDEGKQTNRGWKSVKDEISLSEFLSLEMKWPVESERFGLFDADDMKNHGKGPLQLAGIDFIHSFSEESENSSSLPIEQAINEKSIEFEARRSRSIDVSEKRDLSGGDVKPSENKNGDTFSAWEADFQATSSVAPIPRDYLESSQSSKLPESSQSSKLPESSQSSKLPSVDYASHMDSVFGPLKDFEEGKSIQYSSSLIPPTIKENEPDYRSNFFSGVSILERERDVGIVLDHGEQVLEPNSQNEQEHHLGSLKSVVIVKGVGYDSLDSYKHLKSSTDIGNDQWVTSSTAVSSSAKMSGNDDSSDLWNGCTSFTGSGDNKYPTSTINAPKEGISVDAWNDFTSSGVVSDGQLANRGLNSTEEMSVSVGNDMFGPWNDVTNLKSFEEGQHEVSCKIAISVDSANPKDDGSFMSELDDKLQNTGTVLSVDTVSEKDEYLFNLWDGFMGSTVPQHNPGDSNNVELADGGLNDGDDTADGWGNFVSLTSSRSEKETNSTETHGDEKIKDGSFDSSNDFTSSACRLESKSLNKDMTQAWRDISNPNVEQKIVDQQAPHDKPIVEDDGSHNSWSDFRSSSNTVCNKLFSPNDASINKITNERFSNQSWGDLSISTFQPGQNHTGPMKVSENDTVKDDDVFNSWGDFRTTSVLQSNQWKNSEARMSGVDGLFNDWSSSLTDSKGTSGNQLKVGRDSVLAITKIRENDDSFDAWSEFTGSRTLPGNSEQNFKESQVDDKQDTTGNDLFDAWSLLMTPSSSESTNQNVTSIENSIETSLFNSSGNQKIPGFDSTLQPVLFRDAANDRNGSANLGISSSEALDHFRMNDGDTKSSVDAKQSQKDEPHASGQTSWKKPIDAETLIAEMHDLSFMLESNLSVPKNVD